MRMGVIVPQGWTGEFDGWDPKRAWSRAEAVARRADDLGFESIWVYDHFHTIPEPTEEITFESFTMLAALGAITSSVRLGHVVMCAGYRNPALVAKMISTMDVQTGGRMELGIGAGWKRDEWEGYGYGFPSAGDRLDHLAESLEVITAMMRAGPSTFHGDHVSIDDAINVPQPLQRPRVPIMVGGNGPEVTWRIAARFADELNLDGKTPDEVADDLPVIASRCEEIQRDPESLDVSVHVFTERLSPSGEERVDMLGRYQSLGVSRVIGLVQETAETDEAVESLARDARAAGVEI